MGEESANYILPSMHITEGLLQQQIDATQIVDDVENQLLGKKPFFDKEEGIIKWSDADDSIKLINEKGASILMLQLRTRITKIFQLSYFDPLKIEQLARVFARNTRESLFQHWDEWEIKSITSASIITGLMFDTFLATMQKAHSGKYLQYLANVYDVRENNLMNNSPQQQDKKGVFEKIFN